MKHRFPAVVRLPIPPCLGLLCALFFSACVAPPKNALEANPDKYKHIKFAALTLSARAQGAFDVTEKVSLDQSAEMIRQRTAKIFKEKRFNLEDTPAIRLNNQWTGADDFTRVVCSNLQAKIPQRVAHTKGNVPVYTGAVPLSQLNLSFTEMALTDNCDADALLFFFTDAEVESTGNKAGRYAWNSTGGLVFGTVLSLATSSEWGAIALAESPAWIHHDVVILDAHTGEVIWNKSGHYPTRTLTSRLSINSTVKQTITTLPAVPESPKQGSLH